MAITCPHCSGKVKPKWSKIALVVGGSVAMAPLAAAFGLKAGLVALGMAAWHGNRNAANLLRIKLQLMKASHEMGSFFVCGRCDRDVSVSEVFDQL